jgi:polysaccharide biosynthesis/export protein
VYRMRFLAPLGFALCCATLPGLSQTANKSAAPEKKVEAAAKTSIPAASYAPPAKGPAKSSSQPVASPAAPLQPNGSYRIGVEDELQVSVWREPEISAQVVVRPDGFISLPLLNDIQVVGLSTEELQNMVTTKLKPFVTEPQVTIVVRQIRSRKVYLMGQVARPGSYVLNDDKTALELLAEGGGVTQFAKTKAIYLVRKNGGREMRLRFDYKKALRADNPSSDIHLMPGDMIVVP